MSEASQVSGSAALPQGGQPQVRVGGAMALSVAMPIYFNGFALGAGVTDFTVTLLNGQHAVGTIQAHPSVMKELQRNIEMAIKETELKTGGIVSSLSELQNKVAGQGQ